MPCGGSSLSFREHGWAVTAEVLETKCQCAARACLGEHFTTLAALFQNPCGNSLQFVLEAIKGGQFASETLPLADAEDELVTELASLKGICGHELPVVEHALREGLSGGGLSESASEAERFGDREVGASLNQGSSLLLVLLEDVAPACGERGGGEQLLRVENRDKRRQKKINIHA